MSRLAIQSLDALAVVSWFKKSTSLIALVILFTFCSLASHYFFALTNFQNILRQTAINGFLALGLTMVILVGGIDLSLGGILGLVAIVGALMLKAEYGLIAIVIAGIIIGMFVGATNGLLITSFGIEPFVITLGMQFVLRGLCFSLTEGKTIFVDMPFSVDFIANGDIGPIPFPTILLGAAYFLSYLMMRLTVFGRYLYAVGGNEEVVRLSGINNKLVKVAVYTICGATAAMAGIINLSRINVGDPQAGEGIILFIIGAVIIGGNKFIGGLGGVGYTIIGLLIIGLVSNIIILMGLGYYIQLIAEGAIIIVAVLLQKERKA
ncbi:MAG: ribose ABC transporter permease [Proteobacteria bacterium]|nr:ribose ABC transporter permease [Pseudomonadota bacterium]